jgi:hypothetical protein
MSVSTSKDARDVLETEVNEIMQKQTNGGLKIKNDKSTFR